MTSLYCPHWIPDHRGPEDRARFAAWRPGFLKLVTVDERPPYLEDIPAGARIIIRNHPLSENNGNRNLRASLDDSPEAIAARYDAYFADWEANRTAIRQARAAAVASSAVELGRQHAEACGRMAAYCVARAIPQDCLLFEGLNEPQLWSGEPPAAVAAYYAEFLRCLHANNLHGVAGNFGVGWPGNGGQRDAPVAWDFWRPVIDVMDDGDFLGLHEYWDIGGPQDNWRWWAGRYLQCPYPVPILITETGIDRGVSGNPGGWWELAGSFEQKARTYVDQLALYEAQLRRDPRVRGACIFTYDQSGASWERFNTRNQAYMGAFLPYAQGQPDPVPYQTPAPEPATDGLCAMLAQEFSARFQDLRTSLPRHTAETYDARDLASVRRIIIHHTAPPAGAHESWAGDAAYHVSLGWPGIGYHLGVQADGTVSYLQDIRLITYHASASNTTSIGVAAMGNYELDQPAPAMLGALKRLVAVLERSLGRAVSLQGHKDVDGSTLCPGQNLYPLVGTLRDVPPPAPADPVDVIRAMAWAKVGVALNPDAALFKAARARNLGRPVTNEYSAQGYVCQGYDRGIVYCRLGDWANVKAVDW